MTKHGLSTDPFLRLLVQVVIEWPSSPIKNIITQFTVYEMQFIRTIVVTGKFVSSRKKVSGLKCKFINWIMAKSFTFLLIEIWIL